MAEVRSSIDEATLARLAALAGRADGDVDWPAESWAVLRQAGGLAWAVPRQFGGLGLPAAELLTGYERVAGVCLTTAFILSQREAAVRRLCAYPAGDLQRRLLPGLAAGETFITVGLSQLTTSRPHGGPALLAVDEAGGFRLDGVMPWVTGADRADLLVAGAVLPDGRQVLLVVPAGTPGLVIEPPLPLAALAGSRTAQGRCEGVRLSRDWLLAGPAEKVLSVGGSGVGGVETSCLALGLAGAAIDYLAGEATQRPDLAGAAERFERARQQARPWLHEAAAEKGDPSAAQGLRLECTRLALGACQAALTVAKGAGFVASHPAQRWARQALFFLVWSCPRPVADGLLEALLPD